MEKEMARHHVFGVRVPRWISVIPMVGALALTACASGSKQATIPSDGPTMSDVYRQHREAIGMHGKHSIKERLPLRAPEDNPPSAYVRTAINEIDNRFARVPNPDLVMYVTPHLAAGGRYPVPGYTTVFPLYETVEYAMPGEVSPRQLKWTPPAEEAVSAMPATSKTTVFASKK